MQQRLAIAAGAASVVLLALLYRRRGLAQRVKRSWPHGVEVRESRISGGGDGLFASIDFAEGAWLGEYRGRVLSLLQAHQLEDRDYLMGGFGINMDEVRAPTPGDAGAAAPSTPPPQSLVECVAQMCTNEPEDRLTAVDAEASAAAVMRY